MPSQLAPDLAGRVREGAAALALHAYEIAFWDALADGLD